MEKMGKERAEEIVLAGIGHLSKCTCNGGFSEIKKTQKEIHAFVCDRCHGYGAIPDPDYVKACSVLGLPCKVHSLDARSRTSGDDASNTAYMSFVSNRLLGILNPIPTSVREIYIDLPVLHAGCSQIYFEVSPALSLSLKI